jgi:DNA-binding response OmpR family regulator
MIKFCPTSADSVVTKQIMKILIVDDSRFLRKTNERALQKAGYEVTGTGDGEEGLRLARELRPDLVVLDMMLPKLSGPEVLKALRKDAATAHIPVMVLTSLPQSNEGKLKEEGATAYFQKSALALDKNPDALVQTVKTVLAKAMVATK